MSDSDPIKAAARKSRAARRVGNGAKCRCGEDRPQALIPGTAPMICAECKRRMQGRAIYDRHHVAGKRNHDVTISVPANDHRAVLSEAQQDWPKETLKNPDQSPLRAAAACIRGFIDTITYLLENLLAWIPPFLETVDAFLVDLFGPHWWTDPGFAERLKKKV